ncbi:helix-turn-helix domain-containing protein [Comamonas jiangduensis]|jgi:transcriptional regulator with XRE-family HTH domain|uniref:helix-turn-helix domain-containing protein n=1 Tax=Comamonas jiangduensis TaxID=1194168 RepID=UPI001583C394|nr:helix-turn-helix transcriptional regulator [Comamonas jiangduensis]
MTVPAFTSHLDYSAMGDRLRAYRMGAGLQADEVAEQLGVSRAVVYRMEKGEIVKIETLERLAQLLGTSLASLLGVEAEYYASALALFERMRQIEQSTDRILAHFEPISVLLLSENYLNYLALMLQEALPQGADAQVQARQTLQMVEILRARQRNFEQRKPHIVSLMGLRDLERFVQTGLVGRMDVPAAVRRERIQAAHIEVARIAELMEHAPWFAQIGLVDDAMPSATYQVLTGAHHRVLMQSPFRLGELPNVRNGIATVTASPEAVALHEQMTTQLWAHASKGSEGAQRLRAMLQRVRSD